MSSAAKAKLGALYINAREAIPMRELLEEMGHKQLPTPIQTNNSTAHGVVTNNIQPRRTKAMDMRFTGYVVVTHRANFAIIGAQGPTTEPTTGPSTIAQHITSKNAPHFQLHNSYSMPFGRQPIGLPPLLARDYLA